MHCTLCKGTDIKTRSELDDVDDIEITFCNNKSCGFVLKEEVVTTDEDGKIKKRPRSVKQSNQPEAVTHSRRVITEDKEVLLSAEEMTSLAIKTQEDTIDKLSISIVRDVLKACAEVVLNGQHTYLIKGEVSGAVVSQVVVDLKGKGYKVRKVPNPELGVGIHVKWPTKRTTSSKVNKEKVYPTNKRSRKSRETFEETKESLREK